MLVGDSVGAIIGLLAVAQAPARFSGLVLISPSPRFLDDPPYRGGFSEADIAELLEALDSNYLGWSAATRGPRDPVDVVGAPRPLRARR